ncbi:MAG: hypothetical protein Q7W02_24355 [Candidatus Rokubacteria bacterium]|nr:hypothetical protein [Candidatus Rokubacteria bacterium]
MGLKDAYGNPVSSSSRAAVDAYDRGVRALLGFGASVIDDFRAAVEALLDRRVAKRPNPGRHWLEARA